MLKRPHARRKARKQTPAAFRRLCVETGKRWADYSKAFPAAFRRLCVETKVWIFRQTVIHQPPSGGCVLKQIFKVIEAREENASRLQAAVC